ncbi:MAG TPA: hypothetical protein VFU98_01275 [Microlunatus sp.]|nr:hypothetical protein [Microlunatus sp.]
MGALDALFAGLVDDAAVFPPGNASVPDAVRRHREHRGAWYAPVIGPLVVPDTRLSEVSRAAVAADADIEPVQVSVVVTGGAGGLLPLARRELPGIAVVAAEVALRDLDDLAGNAQRVTAAAQELDPDEVAVFVELPFQHGWVAAIEVVEGAGLFGKLRTGGLEPDAFPTADQLAEQLSELVEADLPFKTTAGLHRAWPNQVVNERGETLAQHGFVTLLMAVEALVDGAGTGEAAELLRLDDPGRIFAALDGWDDATVSRVRRRFRSFGCCGVTEPIDDLVTLGLLAPDGAR